MFGGYKGAIGMVGGHIFGLVYDLFGGMGPEILVESSVGQHGSDGVKDGTESAIH